MIFIEHKNWNSFFTSASLSSNQDKGLAFELLTVQGKHPTNTL